MWSCTYRTENKKAIIIQSLLANVTYLQMLDVKRLDSTADSIIMRNRILQRERLRLFSP